MDYKIMWNKLEKDLRNLASTPIKNTKNIITATESVAKKTTYFEVLNFMKEIEKYEKENDRNYSL